MASTMLDYAEPGGYVKEEKKSGMRLIMCIYCSKLNDLEEGLDCEGCGGNLPMPEPVPYVPSPYTSPYQGGGYPGSGITTDAVMMMTTAALTVENAGWGENSSW